tara:strand:+ start:1593 stop:2612 length:1020 start_codon:yes stop_codon:yes gene_type:complete
MAMMPSTEEELNDSMAVIPVLLVEEEDERYGRFSIGPLDRSYGMTLGNPLRRVLLGSIPGAAITWVKIDGVSHEYTSVPHVREEVFELLLKFKEIRIKALSDRPGKLRLDVSGEGVITAGDIMVPGDFEIVNPELYIATLDSSDAHLVIEFNVEKGAGYISASSNDGYPIGVLPVDSIFTPVSKVSYAVEPMRVGQVTDYEKLIVEIWTDGTVMPSEALIESGNILVKSATLLTTIGSSVIEGGDEESSISANSSVPPEIYNSLVDGLGLSARTLNCLKRAKLNRVGEILEKDKSELMQIRNFGQKSMDELFDKLKELNLLPEETDENTESLDDENIEE